MNLAGRTPFLSSTALSADRLERERSRLLRTILSAGALVSGAMFLLVPLWRENPWPSMVGYGLTCALHVLHLGLVWAGRPLLAARSFSILFLVMSTVLFYVYGGVRGLGGFVYPLVVLFAGLTWSGTAALGIALLSSFTAIAMAFAETRGLLTPVEPEISAGGASAVITAALIMTAVMLFVALRVIRASSEEALELQSGLAKAQRMESLGKLASGLAHDFNNMLTGIIGHAELLTLNAAAHPELKRHAELILSASERAAQLTQQLLMFSRKRDPFIETVGVNQLVRNVLAILELSLDPRIRVVTELEAEPDWVDADAAALESALLNLAVNGRDAMPGGGTLGIRTDRVHGHIRMLVSDSGTGIPVDLHEKIFEPYFTTKEVGKGTGLGLAAVYGTAQEHGGSIEVESQEGAGTTFILRLPPASGPPQTKGKAAGAEISSGPSLRILAIDDEPAVLESLSGMLAQLGHVVDSARHPAEALELLEKNPIDLVILDLVMPEIPGGELLERLRELRPEIPVLVTSGYSDEPLARFRNCARTHFLRKPYRRAELALALSDLTTPSSNPCCDPPLDG